MDAAWTEVSQTRSHRWETGTCAPEAEMRVGVVEVIHGGIGWRWQSCASGGRDLRRTEIAIARLEEGVEGASPFPISEM